MWGQLGRVLTGSKLSALLTRAMIGGKLYPQTAAELAAAVTPTDYAYPPGDVRRYGAVGDDSTDDTASIQAAFDIAAGSYGAEVYFPRGTYKVTSTIQCVDLRGSIVHGEGPGAFGGNGATIKWYGGALSPIFEVDFFKNSLMENLTIVGADTSTNRATACMVFHPVTLSGSTGPSVIRNCWFDNAEYGVMLGDTSYANTYNVSELTFQNCRFNARYGLFIAGVASGSQNVNTRLIACDFGGVLSERGIWLDGGNVFATGCSWNGAYNVTTPFTAIYMTGDRSLAPITTIRDCYAETIAKFLETEYTATASQFFRSASMVIENCWLRCNNPMGGSAYLVECYKTVELELRNVTSTAGDVLYSPPADAASSGYSGTAPASAVIRLAGYNDIAGAITTARGGYLLSMDRSIRGGMPWGYVYPDTATNIMAIPAGVKNLPEYGCYTTFTPNGTFDVNTISGGRVGDVLHLMGHPTQATFRIANMKHAVGNIRLATFADFALGTVTKKLMLRLDHDGNWYEIGRVEV